MLAIFCAVTFVTVALSAEAVKQSVKYPDGYRQWALVKTMVIQEGHKIYDMFGGIHQIYANKKAFDALTKAKPYPNGAVFVFDLQEAVSKDNAISQGPRKFIAVIQKDAKKFADTGGWGFEGFKGDSKDRMVTDMKTCFKCHDSKKETGYVFSQYPK